MLKDGEFHPPFQIELTEEGAQNLAEETVQQYIDLAASVALDRYGIDVPLDRPLTIEELNDILRLGESANLLMPEFLNVDDPAVQTDAVLLTREFQWLRKQENLSEEDQERLQALREWYQAALGDEIWQPVAQVGPKQDPSRKRFLRANNPSDANGTEIRDIFTPTMIRLVDVFGDPQVMMRFLIDGIKYDYFRKLGNSDTYHRLIAELEQAERNFQFEIRSDPETYQHIRRAVNETPALQNLLQIPTNEPFANFIVRAEREQAEAALDNAHILAYLSYTQPGLLARFLAPGDASVSKPDHSSIKVVAATELGDYEMGLATLEQQPHLIPALRIALTSKASRAIEEGNIKTILAGNQTQLEEKITSLSRNDHLGG